MLRASSRGACGSFAGPRSSPLLKTTSSGRGDDDHDYKRNGTTTLFAALDVKTGLVIGECHPRHRAKEFIQFLKRIDRCVQKHLDLRLVLDNYGTHKTPAVKRWLLKHRRFHLHFTPTSASWLNLVERFFAEITQKRIRRGAFGNVAELENAIQDYLECHNANPKPFVWTKSAEVILTKERRALELLEAMKPGYQPSDSEQWNGFDDWCSSIKPNPQVP